jgi:hypothetical protein
MLFTDFEICLKSVNFYFFTTVNFECKECYGPIVYNNNYCPLLNHCLLNHFAPLRSQVTSSDTYQKECRFL